MPNAQQLTAVADAALEGFERRRGLAVAMQGLGEVALGERDLRVQVAVDLTAERQCFAQGLDSVAGAARLAEQHTQHIQRLGEARGIAQVAMDLERIARESLRARVLAPRSMHRSQATHGGRDPGSAHALLGNRQVDGLANQSLRVVRVAELQPHRGEIREAVDER
jgi:predicted HTH domain antitoxin